ncbi:hypothetical protein X975_03922, partial [Stegodyphus mimosarum]
MCVCYQSSKIYFHYCLFIIIGGKSLQKSHLSDLGVTWWQSFQRPFWNFYRHT